MIDTVKRMLCALLALCLLTGSVPALALTGMEALGLVDSSSKGSGISASYPTLQVGSRDGDDEGAYVVMLQNRLQELGYLYSSADGQFGSMTETAVLLFQETNGLTPTGIADDSTQSVLYSKSAKTAPIQADLDSSVVRVQQMLILYGFMYGRADGVIGDTTRKAVAEFKDYIYNQNQAAFAAYQTPAPTPEPTPAPGEQPVAMDVAVDVNSVNGQNGDITEDIVKFATGEYSFEPFQHTVMSGSSGADVWRVQRRLRQLKYLYRPDGGFGSLTDAALRYFQRKNNLSETGVADQATQKVLFSENAVSSEEYVLPYKLFVDREKQRVFVYQWTGGGYDEELGSFKCSTGMEGYETPLGTYQAAGKVHLDEWYYFANYNCYAKYAYRIVGGIMFHSVLYNAQKVGPTQASVNALGKAVSHGCVRLLEKNAQWIFENCPEGTTVVVR